MKFSTGAVLATFATSVAPALALPSFQTGPNNGAVYAAGLTRDGDTGDLYITGITYDPSIGDGNFGETTSASSCFVMSLDYDVSQAVPEVSSTVIYGADDNVVDTCRGVAILSDQQLVVVGNADPGGLYTDELPSGAVQVGFGMTLSRSDLSAITGSSLFSAQVPYPQAIVVDPNDADSIYIASMTTDANQNNSPDTEYPNWTHQFQHGTAFQMTVERLQYTKEGTGNTFDGILDGMQNSGEGDPVLKRTWSKTFPFDSRSDGSEPTAYVGGMIWKEGTGLIVAGSTSGLGVGYGAAAGRDEDGFITILDPDSGELAVPPAVRKNNQRFGTSEFDVVTSICDDPDDPDAFYIVGATKGDINGIREDDVPVVDGSLQAFIKKVNVFSLHGEWTVQHGAQSGNSITETTALGCVAYGDVVYVTGIVNADAGMIDGPQVHTSSGGDDIWIAQYSAANGSVKWMKQIGSDGDDHVARSAAIEVDSQGNAIIVGDTSGAMYRDRSISTSTDLFVVTLDYSNGDYATTIQVDSANDAPEESVIEDLDEPLPQFGNTDAEDLPTEAVTPASAQVHQSGPNSGALYASSIVYDAISDQAIISGISYTDSTGRVMDQPNCLVARLEIGSMETKKYTILGTEGVLESCRGVALSNAVSSIINATVVLVGNSEPGGLYADDNEVQAGFGMSLSGDDLESLQGTSLFSDSIPYPQAVVVDGNDIYVASMNSNDQEQNANGQTGTDFPNWTFRNKYGKGFTMTVEKLSLPNFESVWSEAYPVEPESDGTVNSVLVGGLILKDGKLIVVGSTRAKGEAYGPAAGDDADGYITVLDPNSGALFSGVKNNVRIGSAADDVVSEICDVPDDGNSFVIVGATKGDVKGLRSQEVNIADGSLQWFAKKINLDTLNEAWSIQGGAVFSGANSELPTSSFAVGCHVLGSAVYVGGTVEDGAQIVVGSSTNNDAMGGDDVWVAKLDLTDGSINWLRQLGSVGDDQLARNGGITTDKDGDVLIYGDTTGAIARARSVSSNSDIFLAVLKAADGGYEIKGTPAPGSGPAAVMPVSQPTVAPVAPPVLKESFNDENDVIPDDIVAIQLGPDVGPTYAGGMDYDAETNSLYLTGATYGAFSGPGVRAEKRSDCFFARIDMPELEVIQRDKYGVSMEPDSCTAIAANDYNGQRNVIAIGSTEAGGLLTELTDASSLQYGFAMDLSLQHKFEFLGGAVVGSGLVTFPVDIVADGNQFWTISMTSDSNKVSADYDKVKFDKYPNFTNGGVQKYGLAYTMTVQSFTMARVGDGNPFAQGATQSFESELMNDISLGSQHEGMLVNGMILVGNTHLIAVGAVHKGGNVDGFMAKISRRTGTLELGDGKAVGYYRGSSESDDWIMNACADPTTAGHFFIVGASSGKDVSAKKQNGSTVHAFVAKVSTITMRTVWEKQFLVMHPDAQKKGKYAAAAYGCDVVPIEDILYVGGTVEDGAVIADTQRGNTPGVSAGRDDIFVASLSASSGQLTWIKQTGSNGDDRLARAGGIKADFNGNAIVYGETTGDFYRMRSDADAKQRYSDLFLMMFDKHYGIHQSPMIGPKLSGSSTPTEFFNDITESGRKGGFIVGIVVLLIVILGLVYFLYCRCCRRNMKEIPSLYDAAAADLGYDDQTTTSLTSGGGGLGLGLFRDQAKDDSLKGEPNLNYRDDVEDHGSLVGNFHKTYSDLPQNGKEII